MRAAHRDDRCDAYRCEGFELELRCFGGIRHVDLRGQCGRIMTLLGMDVEELTLVLVAKSLKK